MFVLLSLVCFFECAHRRHNFLINTSLVFLASRFDAMMIQWSHMHNFDLGVSTCPHTDGFNLVNDFVIMFEDEEYVETIGKLLYGCQCLDMTHEEQAMMAAICVMCSRE